jgi:predicted acylesterase/phospholipase RssA
VAASEPPEYGLALSGGGFRAAFFHVGVLARLAEIDVLPKIEVISTVSGGSIVGALYYVRLKRLLESTPDGGIGKNGYMRLVADVESDLRRGVQKDIRGRIFANPWKNLKMAAWGPYSRSDRIGDLCDRHIYGKAWGERPGKWGLPGPVPKKPVELQELLIAPLGAGKSFNPARQNKNRREKVPVLLINATSLNSGHNWRFEAIRMGESLPEDEDSASIVEQVDKNMRLMPGYFDPTPPQRPVPEQHMAIPLAKGVAASAGVPGVFQPLTLDEMYDGVTVQLVDGGVQDNQGIQGLLDWECDRIIVSDASGQMSDMEKPSARIPGVVGRSGSIARDRIRDEQLIAALEKPVAKRAVMHLRMGLQVTAVGPGESRADAPTELAGDCSTTDFEVAEDVQSALSRIRTDLDHFSDAEASSLELDGYLMSRFELAQNGFGDGDQLFDWVFYEKSLRKALESGSDRRLMRRLEAGRRRFLRFLWMWKPGPAVAGVLLTLAAATAIFLAWDRTVEALGSQMPLWWLLAGLFAAVLLGFAYGLNPRGRVMRFAIGMALRVVLLFLGAVAALAAPLVFATVLGKELGRKPFKRRWIRQTRTS